MGSKPGILTLNENSHTQNIKQNLSFSRLKKKTHNYPLIHFEVLKMLYVSHKLFICTLGSNKICFSQSCNELNQASLPYTTAKNVEKALGSQNNAETVCSGHCLVILPMAPEAHYYVPACQFILKSTAMPESLTRSFGARTCLSASPNSLNAGES